MTVTAPTTGSLPRQRTSSARHREPVSTHELDVEPTEDWTVMCDARRCDGTCARWRISAGLKAALGPWSVIEVKA